MDLILWRHADAEPDDRDDRARRLSARGKKQARRVAKWLRERLPRDAIVLASPARRAQETAAALTDRYRIDPQLDTGARACDVLAAAGWPGGSRSVVVVGHQPALGRVASLALTGVEADWRIVKGSIWWLGLDEGGSGEVIVRGVISPDL
jgi:phosphohistidine phosphatase